MASPSRPADESLEARLLARIDAEGPLAFSSFVHAALYDPHEGFYAGTGRAGRRGDFLTSPEVGPLFGAVLARALDTWWDDLGRPDPFVVIEGGAGPGTLARTVLVARPRCAEALVHVLVETSAAQRRAHAAHQGAWVGERAGPELAAVCTTPRGGGGPAVVSAPDLPEVAVRGVVVANELLDNLPFDPVARTTDGVDELRVARGDDVPFAPVVVPRPATPDDDVVLGALPTGVWAPDQHRAAAWVARARGCLLEGRVVVADYGATDADLADRPPLAWMRTFRGHERGGHPLDAPGTQDITADVAVDQLLRARPGATVSSQADFLARHGIEALVEEGRRIWHERAHLGDLEALRGRSRVAEAEALLDPEGLGGFTVVEWDVHPDDASG